MISVSSNCWSKWRVSSSTAFCSSRSLLAIARSRNSPTVIMVPSVMAATSRQPQMISQTMGSRPRATAKRRSVAAVMRDILPRMLEINARIPHSQEGHAYNAEMA